MLGFLSLSHNSKNESRALRPFIFQVATLNLKPRRLRITYPTGLCFEWLLVPPENEGSSLNSESSFDKGNADKDNPVL